MARWVVLGLLLAGAILVAVVGGWGGLAVYAFFAAIAAALAFGAGVAGGWLEGSSRGRFAERRSRDRT